MVVTSTGARTAATAPALAAVLFDLDGTLYEQRPVRLRMAVELAAFAAMKPSAGLRTLRVLKTYREAQEALRAGRAPYDPEQQIALAADRSGVPQREAAPIVEEWMFERPLKHLARFRARGLEPLLARLMDRGLQLGVVSDYEAHRKLKALGVSSCFSQVLCAGDPDVRALKPDPRGLLLACARWQIDPSDAVMVGDRADVDGAGAAAAHMRSIIIGRRPADCLDLRTTFVSSLEQVSSVLDDCR